MQLMERNPEFAQLMNNPQLLRETLQASANPVRHENDCCLDTCPTVSHIQEQFLQPRCESDLAGSPQALQVDMQGLMREQMRNADRAMSNIESHPEGFNMLRRMYENIQVRQRCPQVHLLIVKLTSARLFSPHKQADWQQQRQLCTSTFPLHSLNC